MLATELLITPAELAAQLGDAELRVFDCRWSLAEPTLGKMQFTERHIPTAQYMPLEPALSDPASILGRHPLPSKERFADTLRTVGISNNSSVVAYDAGACMFACRFWWMLRWVGHVDVRVLDGGLYQWDAGDLETTAVCTPVRRGRFQTGMAFTETCDSTNLLDGEYTLIDARSLDRFQGQNETIDHTAGHIPGALCYPFNENQAADKTFKRTPIRFNSLNPDRPVVSYCGSGVSATHNIMALLLAGFAEPILYPGSWSEWIEDSNRPIAK